MAKLRIAQIGAGIMGRQHIGALAKSDRVDLVAIADPMQRVGECADGIKRFADYRDMLDAIRPDGVIVATPPITHVDIGLDCLTRGVAALIEKPVSDSLATALLLEQAVEQSDVPILIGHHRRHNTILSTAQREIAEGRVGDVLAVVSTWLRRKADDYYADIWKTRKGGGGVLLINTIHDFDCLRMLCGEIEAVSAVTSNKGRGYEVEDTAVVMLRFASGALGTMTVSDATQAPWCWETTSGEDPRFARADENCFLICGTKGSLSIPTLNFWDNANGLGRADPMTRTRLHHEANDALLAEHAHFFDVVEGKVKPMVAVADANRTLAATLAVWEAERRGGWVSIDEMIAMAATENKDVA